MTCTTQLDISLVGSGILTDLVVQVKSTEAKQLRTYQTNFDKLVDSGIKNIFNTSQAEGSRSVLQYVHLHPRREGLVELFEVS